ncbi:MAG: L-threonylcarbamoyladenylate synthase [Candidatus Poseidoniaceae archaeon]|jgi:L-threonylcarbamoyladenylate synthase|nr:L-threonylcarbamoyladenylate synthase [Candidatus Poseidoniaceae archaeon]
MRHHLESGGLIVYPTSTLPGLGCLPQKNGLDNLFETKKRPDTMPVSLGVVSMTQVKDLVVIPEFVDGLLEFFPKGSLTIILPALAKVDSRLGGENIGIRVFSHPEAIKLAKEFGPITATSANESGNLTECDVEIAAKTLGIEKFIPGICPNEGGSTIIQFTVDSLIWSLIIMREGVVPREDVKRWWTSQT